MHADVSLYWAHMSDGTFSHVVAYLSSTIEVWHLMERSVVISRSMSLCHTATELSEKGILQGLRTKIQAPAVSPVNLIGSSTTVTQCFIVLHKCLAVLVAFAPS